MSRAFAQIAQTNTVRRVQAERGVREANQRFLDPDHAAGDSLGENEKSFIAMRDGFYQATVSESGWPYVQFRGGPRGFLKSLDSKTLAYADFRGNRQYISTGNVESDARVSLILMDYPNRARLKVWGHAKLVDAELDPALARAVAVSGYRALVERTVVITVAAFDWNCPSHIPQRLTAEEMRPAIGKLHARIAELEAENAELRQRTEAN
ncbi:MAG: pyridoxamine 5'-phosphate oxidase family protein [Pseudomonadota bacterium]